MTSGDAPLPGVTWRKARKSASSACVEVGAASGLIAVRDSKNPDAGVLLYTHPEWAAFIDGVKNGEFDDLLG